VDYAYEAEFDQDRNDSKDHYRRVKFAYQKFLPLPFDTV
jgi:hypothetical protein